MATYTCRNCGDIDHSYNNGICMRCGSKSRNVSGQEYDSAEPKKTKKQVNPHRKGTK